MTSSFSSELFIKKRNRFLVLYVCASAAAATVALMGDRFLAALVFLITFTAIGYLAFARLHDMDRLARMASENEHRFRILTESIPNLLFIYDLTDCRTVYANGELATILGYNSADLAKMSIESFKKLVHPDDLAVVSRAQKEIQALKVGESLDVECRVKHAGGDWRSIFTRLIVFARMPNSAANQILCVGHDVTALKRAQDDVKQLARLAIDKQRLALLGELSASVAHEFRNPLMGVQHCVEDLHQRCGADSPLLSTVSLLKDGLQRMDHISERLLRLARTDSGEKMPSDVQQCIEATCAFVRSRAQRQGVALHMQIQPGLPLVNMHAERISEALLNLIHNAIDACKPGESITVSARLAPEAPNMLELAVADTGSGIAPEVRSHIFEAFYTTKEAGKGTGLGMTIVKRNIEAHGGIVEVLDTPVRGTTFRLRIPIQPLLPEEAHR
jgi:PAS domain S-box-containing protein